MMRRILITGGFGYIGGRVAKHLASLPNTHVILGSRNPIESPDWLPQASVVTTCWNDFSKLQATCKEVDIVLHMAAMNEIDSAKDPAGALESTGVGTARLVEAAKGAQVGQFIYLSTAHVYRAPLTGRIDESSCPHPVHPYATSHRAAEDIVLANSSDIFKTIVLRLSNAFGTPIHPDVNRWTLLVNDLCRQAVTTGKLMLKSTGLQRRDFVTLTDVANAVEHIMGLPQYEVGDGIFNIGGAWSPTVMEVATLIANRCKEVLGYYPEISHPEPSSDEVSQLLDYRIDKLLESGFKLDSNYNAEIDGTIKLCQQAFSKGNRHF